VLAWKGRAVAVVDLGALTGYCTPLGPAGNRGRTVMLEVGNVTFAVLASAVREVHTVSDQDIRPAHATRQKFSGQEVELFKVPVPILDLGSIVQAVT
jgi:chemotaxis signal transduction protein